ncbi:MAG: hypothetical protein ACOYNO_01280 [Saprospiraceae bacterium]
MTILLLAPFYAPYIHPRAHRWTAIAEYWAAKGHRVLVVTARVKNQPDEESINRVEVFRTGFDSLKTMLAHGTPKLPERGRVGERPASGTWPWRVAERLYQSGWKKICFPDDALFWRRPAIRKARTLFQHEQIDALVSVSLPITAHRVAAALKNDGLFWLADVGDPFAAPGWEISNPILYGTRAKQLESELMKAANAVVVTNNSLKCWFEEAYGLKNVHLVPPLLHPTITWEGAPMRKAPGEQLDFGYFGAFYPPVREPFDMVAFFKALRPYLPTFTLHVYGELLPRYVPLFAQHDWIKCHGLQPRDVAQKAMFEMDVLVNVGNQNPHLLPSKAVHYLLAGRPVLHVQSLEKDAFMMFMEDQISLLHIREIQNMDAEAIIRWMFKPFTPKPVFEPQPYTVETIGDAYLRILKGGK